MKAKVASSCPTLCDPMDYAVHGILQARILEWVAVPFSRGSSQPRDWTQDSSIAGRFFASWAIREAHNYSKLMNNYSTLMVKIISIKRNFSLPFLLNHSIFVLTWKFLLPYLVGKIREKVKMCFKRKINQKNCFIWVSFMLLWNTDTQIKPKVLSF